MVAGLLCFTPRRIKAEKGPFADSKEMESNTSQWFRLVDHSTD